MDHATGNAIELIEGTSSYVNMTASANPLPIEYEWSKESSATLELEKLVPSADHRLSVSGGVLNISNVRRQDSGYYTISATNAEGTTQTKIKIDVLYSPRYFHATHLKIWQSNAYLDTFAGSQTSQAVSWLDRVNQLI